MVPYWKATDKRVPGAYLPASLGRLLSSGVSEGPCLKRQLSGEGSTKTPSANLWPVHVYVRAHTHTNWAGLEAGASIKVHEVFIHVTSLPRPPKGTEFDWCHSLDWNCVLVVMESRRV